jgi:hypothetical protein
MSSTTEATIETSTTTSALVTRVRNQWAAVQAQWVAMPDTLRHAWEQIGERIRAALDLPTKQEIAQLTARLDELDRRLAMLSEPRANAPAADVASTPAVAAPPPDGTEPAIPSRSKITADKRVRKR